MWLCHFRYCLLNRKLKSRSKRYNKRIPSTLHGRPHAFVKHVWRRLEASKNLQSHNYLVTQGENPSCICMDFRRHSYPCKHIISGWFHDGELIIPSTANDPWWNADGYVVEHRVSKKGNPKTKTATMKSQKRILEKHHKLTRANKKIHDLLGHIRTQTYLNTDIQTAHATVALLEAISNQYARTSKRCSKLPLSTSSVKITKKRKKKQVVRPDGVLQPKRSKTNANRSFLKAGRQSVHRPFVVKDLASCQSRCTNSCDDESEKSLSMQAGLLLC